ncbi:tetratricopeptide repeat protein [Flavobacterium jumunjinense]|uniref:Tetratricopeptide repeat protein n=2 Tax=Flavobacterium jumunjinense TaxID=998845 RepID=A0ABV5GLX6_9FLAO|nr:MULTISPECIES: tetratricopeptide repeat protein [Flavobacterium]
MNSFKKNSLFFFLFFFFSGSMQSQESKIDSLKRELQIHKVKDTTRVRVLTKLAFSYQRTDPEKALEYIEEIYRISETINFEKGKAQAFYLRGIVQVSLSNYEEALLYFNKSKKIYKALGMKEGELRCYDAIGVVFYYQGNYRESIKSYEKEIKINEEIGKTKVNYSLLSKIGSSYSELGDYERAIVFYEKALGDATSPEARSICFNHIGTLYCDLGNYPVALENYTQSLMICEKIKDTLQISKSLNNIAIIYNKYENYDKAIEYYERSLKIEEKINNKYGISRVLNNIGVVCKSRGDNKKAIEYYEKSLKIGREVNDKNQISNCLLNLGDMSLILSNNTRALQYYEEAKKINIEMESQRGLCSSIFGIANTYVNQKKYDLALINALKSKELSDKLGIINFKRDTYELLSEIYENTGSYKKAFVSHKQFKILDDSLFNKENINKIAQLEYEYKYKGQLESANNRELKLTQTVKSTSKDLVKSQRVLFLGVIISLLITIILGAIIFFLKLRNIKSKTQNSIIEQKLLRSQMTPHFIFNSLSVLQGMILNKEEGKSINYLSKFSKLLRITLENSRDKMVSLSQELMAIENYLALQNLENELYKYTVLVDGTMNTELFKIPPMLIQPFIENAIEHGFENQKEDREIDVHLNYINKKLICTISDNGIGVDAKKENKNPYKKSLATTITSERLGVLSKDLKMEGSVVIEDRQKYNKQGTIVTLVIPYKIQEQE